MAARRHASSVKSAGAYLRGKEAATVGLPLAANPFTLKPWRTDWARGWREQRKLARGGA